MIDVSKLHAGDSLSRLKGAVRHWGIYLGFGRVLEIVPQSAPRVVPLEVFADGQTIKVHRSPASERAAILQRAAEVQVNNEPYHWLSNNCQHLKNYVLSGKRFSEGILALTAIGAISAFFALTRRA